MGKSQRNAWELKVTNGEERESEHFSILVGLNGQRSKKTVVREEKRYNTSPGPNGQISCGSAVMRHSRASGAALPHQVRRNRLS